VRRSGTSATADERRSAVRALRRARPRDRYLRLSGWIAGVGIALAWASGSFRLSGFLDPRRRANLDRFLTSEALPEPLREGGSGDLLGWVLEVWNSVGREGTLATLEIAVSASVLAAGFGLLAASPAARTLATASPFSDSSEPTGAWRLLVALTRLLCVLMRALPEYVLAFLLAALLPQSAWPAVLALAIHNGGILGRLYGDTVENVPPGPLASLHSAGARRREVFLFAAFPLALPRFLLYFFYRLESCVREATILGLLGFVSLGYWIDDARSRFAYDQMLLLIAFGIVIVLVADLLSNVVRERVRRAA